MEMASIINQYYDAFIIRYGDTALPGHLKALNAIRRCRTPDSGELYVRCTECNHGQWATSILWPPQLPTVSEP